MIAFLRRILHLLESIDRKFADRIKSDMTTEERTLDNLDVNKLLTRMMVVSKLGISERTYNRWVKRGLLIPIAFGNKHFYREEDLKDAIRRSINKGHI